MQRRHVADHSCSARQVGQRMRSGLSVSILKEVLTLIKIEYQIFDFGGDPPDLLF